MEAAPLNIKKCSIEQHGEFNRFYKRNFKTISDCMFGRDLSITGEDLAQEAMLYIWKHFWCDLRPGTVRADGVIEEGFLTFSDYNGYSNPITWLRMKCRQLISNMSRDKARRSKYQLVSTDQETSESGLDKSDETSVAYATSVVSVQASKDLLLRIWELLEENYHDIEIAKILFFVCLGNNIPEALDIFGVTKESFNARFQKFDQGVFESIKEQIQKEYSE